MLDESNSNPNSILPKLPSEQYVHDKKNSLGNRNSQNRLFSEKSIPVVPVNPVSEASISPRNSQNNSKLPSFEEKPFMPQRRSFFQKNQCSPVGNEKSSDSFVRVEKEFPILPIT